jgi:hypothetical protein
VKTGSFMKFLWERMGETLIKARTSRKDADRIKIYANEKVEENFRADLRQFCSSIINV